jgi:hypothetical protein
VLLLLHAGRRANDLDDRSAPGGFGWPQHGHTDDSSSDKLGQ